jgi:hypothetical protein
MPEYGECFAENKIDLSVLPHLIRFFVRACRGLCRQRMLRTGIDGMGAVREKRSTGDVGTSTRGDGADSRALFRPSIF